MANTPNLDLVKPAGTDHALVSVINANSDKIDSGFGTLSEQIATYQIGSQNSLANLESAIKTFAATISDYQSHPISVVPAFSTTVFIRNSTYIGHLYRRNATNMTVILLSQNGDTIRGSCASDTWTWEQLATKYMSEQLNTNVVSCSSGQFYTLGTFTPPQDGQYIIVLSVSFPEGGTSDRNNIILVDTSETNSNNTANSTLIKGSRAVAEKTRLFTLKTTDTIYFRAYQNGGTEISIGGSYRWIRL